MKKWTDPDLTLSEALRKIGAEPYYTRYSQGGSNACWKIEDTYGEGGKEWKVLIYLSKERNMVTDLEFFDSSINPARYADKGLFMRSMKTFKKVWEKLEKFMVDKLKEGEWYE